LYTHEHLILTLRSGKQIKGAPVKVTSDSITLKHGLSTAIFSKSDVTKVDCLRVMPASDGFNLALAEAPFFAIFYPEFYHRIAGLKGRLHVRLYDASRPEDNTALTCSRR
jgi:hypothetical protein